MRILFNSTLLFLLFAIPARWYFVCEVRHNCSDELTEMLPKPKTLQLVHGDSIILNGFEQITFPANKTNLFLSKDNRLFLNSVTDYLKENEDKNINITGFYRPAEIGQFIGIYENYGLARAAAIENYFENAGIDEARISLDYQLAENDSLSQPLYFQSYPAKKAIDDLVRLQYRFEDMTYSDTNFEADSPVFDPSVACLNYLDALQIYFDSNPDKALLINCHTAKAESDVKKDNEELGKLRAENIKEYIETNYEINVPIQAISLGSTEPVTSTKQSDGRGDPQTNKRNRRVNFKVVQNEIDS